MPPMIFYGFVDAAGELLTAGKRRAVVGALVGFGDGVGTEIVPIACMSVAILLLWLV